MARSNPRKPKKDNGGIPTLFGVWFVAIAAAVACFIFLPRPGASQASPTYGPSPTEGLYRAMIILGLAGVALLDALVAAIKTFRRRRALTAGTKSLGYIPLFLTMGSIGILLLYVFQPLLPENIKNFIFTTGSIGILLQQLFGK